MDDKDDFMKSELTFIDLIDTSEAEKKFLELLEQKKTYFLNGPWGSGKTTFLENVEKIERKKRNWRSQKKFIFLDLWNLKDDRSTIHIAASRINRKIYLLFRMAIISSVVISILMTPAFDLGLGQKFLIQTFRLPITIIALFVSVWQLLKFNSDRFYTALYDSCIGSYLCRNKVLIIDDFDRISPDTQKSAYKLFNVLNNKLPIVFVGDFENIINNENDYLRKIIDQRVELPYVLHPQKIWGDYFERLGTIFDLEIKESLATIFIEDNRNLRDLDQFSFYLKQELIKYKKLGHTQIEQQLAIIYLYLFYPDKYRDTLKSKKFLGSVEYQKYKNDEKNPTRSYQKKTEDLLSDILEYNQNYPQCFIDNPEGYFIYESISSLSIVDCEEILKDSELLRKNIKGVESFNDDFFHFIRSRFENFDSTMRDNLLHLS